MQTYRRRAGRGGTKAHPPLVSTGRVPGASKGEDVKSNLYADRDPRQLEPWYSRHVSSMTTEGLHDKADIAAELAYRDLQIETSQQATAACMKRIDELWAKLEERDARWRETTKAIQYVLDCYGDTGDWYGVLKKAIEANGIEAKARGWSIFVSGDRP